MLLSFWGNRGMVHFFFQSLSCTTTSDPFFLQLKKRKSQLRTTHVRYVYQGFPVILSFERKNPIGTWPRHRKFDQHFWEGFQPHRFFVGRVAIFTPSLPPKKHHIPPFPQQKFVTRLGPSHSRPLSRNLGKPTKTTILPSHWCHGYEQFRSQGWVFSGSPLGTKMAPLLNKNTVGFSTQLFPLGKLPPQDQRKTRKALWSFNVASPKAPRRVALQVRGWVFDPLTLP